MPTRPLILVALLAAATLTGCGASGLNGRYTTSPGSDHGFELQNGGTVISHASGDAMRGTYSVSGSTVTVCPCAPT